ncbi:UvrD-helicase domain-containing protein [Candidatus Poribacteria bacterium]|nr:UvrD-helicase domain-containing protein [Candidatus Poribacteria bacterium]
MEILQELNEKQRQAATHIDGAILVVAGPGTGKTKVITHRIAHLIRNHQVPPQQLFAVTFTNKAAQEMLERVKGLLGATQGLDVRIHTFHAFCVRLLREHASEIGLSKNFTIFDQETQDDILIECLRELKQNRLNYPPWLLRDIISAYKVQLADATANRNEIRTGDGAVIDDPIEIQNITDLIKAYQTKLASHNALDFDDLIAKSVEVLEGAPSVRAKYHHDIRFILVDEYQDINAAQYALLKLLCRVPEHNLMVVADEDQSIYSWRGSSPQYIEQFKADFQPTIVELEEHYRCSEKILRASQAVISKNTRQKESILKTHKGAGHTIYHYTPDYPEDEANLIVKLIRQLVDRRHYSYGNIAVFYRTHQLAEPLADRLHQEHILFQRVGRTNSFQEESAKDIVSYLNFVQWKLPRDIERAINFPQQLIDDLTLVRLKWLAQRKGITLVDLLRKIDDYPEDVGPLTRRNVRQFLHQIDEFAREIAGEKISKIAMKLFALLEHRRSPYRLYSAIKRGEPIQLVASYGIDAYCAAHIIRQTIERYLNLKIRTYLLPPDEQDIPMIKKNGVNILIGRFENLPETEAITILLGSIPDANANVIQLAPPFPPQSWGGTEGGARMGNPPSNSLTALKLCQRVVGYFETPNFADMIVYDLETVDNDPKRAEIIEIGAKRLSMIGSELERYYQLVKPTHGIPKSSTQIHGIDNKTIENEPTIEAVLPQFLSFIQERILIGHNVVAFDNLVLERDLGKYLRVGLSNPYYDTLVTAQRLYPRESCNLEALASKFNIEHDQMHRAIEDVQVTHRVFEELIKEDLRRREVRSLTEFLPLVGIGILSTGLGQMIVAEGQGDKEKEEREGYTPLTEAQVFYQAATRYVQLHRPDLDWLAEGLQPTERQWIKEFIEALYRTSPPESQEDMDWESRRAKFMNGVLHFETNSVEKELSDFLDYQKLINSADETEVQADKVTLMTLHAAKGTEFTVVLIMGMEEGSFPIRRKDQPLAEIEEERRLFYVGMTRAQERLYLTSVLRRNSDRERAHSMFVREIPSNLIQRWSPRGKRKM